MADGMIYLWIGATLLFFIFEAISYSLTTIWMALGAVVAFIAASLGCPWYVQLVLFAASTVILFIFTRPFAIKYLKVGASKTNVDLIIGKQTIVTEEIDNLESKGQIKVGGLYWSARSEDGCIIKLGEKVEIVRVAGVCAYVKRIHN